jgi:Cu-processing system permease protein
MTQPPFSVFNGNVMIHILLSTFKGILRDKISHSILFIAFLFLFIPSASAFSLRQVAQLAITLSLSLTSFLLLILAIFLGGTSLWKDIERRYVHSVLGGTPISRASYLLGKYCGIGLFVILTAFLLGVLSLAAIWFAAMAFPPDRPLLWLNILTAVFFDALKYVLLVAVAFLLSTVSTSFFLPIFGTIATFLAGSATQNVYDYLHTSQGEQLSAGVKATALFFYYILPNFSAFDLKANAIYGLPLDPGGLFLTFAYAAIYIAILLSSASLLFTRRELQ